MAKGAIGVAAVHRELLALLGRKSTSLALVELNGSHDAYGVCHRNGDRLERLEIHVDQDRAAIVEGVLHELMHAFMDLGVVLDTELEEVVVVALTLQTTAYVMEKPGRLARWRRAIQAKLDAA